MNSQTAAADVPAYISNADVPRFSVAWGHENLLPATIVVRAVHYGWLESRLAKEETKLEHVENKMKKLLEANERLQRLERGEHAAMEHAEIEEHRLRTELAEARGQVEAAHADLRNLRAGETCTVEYDLSPAMVEGAIRDKLIELGWTPPARQAARAEPVVGEKV